MKKNLGEDVTIQRVLRNGQALIILDKKGNFKCLYCLTGEKVLKITIGKNGKQKVQTIWLCDIESELKGKL